jgi:hypothetical protein
MNDHCRRYHVTVTISKDGRSRPDPAEFAVAAKEAAAKRAAGDVLSAHTAEKIISVVAVEAADQSSAVATSLAVVSEALAACAGLPPPERDRQAVTARASASVIPGR